MTTAAADRPARVLSATSAPTLSAIRPATRAPVGMAAPSPAIRCGGLHAATGPPPVR